MFTFVRNQCSTSPEYAWETAKSLRDRAFYGTIDGTGVYPRVIVKRALELNAAAVIFAHQHPSGVAESSQADERITRRLNSALELVDVRVLDHLVIGGDAVVSLAFRGLL